MFNHIDYEVAARNTPGKVCEVKIILGDHRNTITITGNKKDFEALQETIKSIINLEDWEELD